MDALDIFLQEIWKKRMNRIKRPLDGINTLNKWMGGGGSSHGIYVPLYLIGIRVRVGGVRVGYGG